MDPRFRLHNNMSALTMIYCSNMYLKESKTVFKGTEKRWINLEFSVYRGPINVEEQWKCIFTGVSRKMQRACHFTSFQGK